MVVGIIAGDGTAPFTFLCHFLSISDLPSVSLPCVESHPTGALDLGHVTDLAPHLPADETAPSLPSQRVCLVSLMFCSAVVLSYLFNEKAVEHGISLFSESSLGQVR